jgi:Ser/Thr protein kinase RdoA (MazF antagonist)
MTATHTRAARELLDRHGVAAARLVVLKDAPDFVFSVRTASAEKFLLRLRRSPLPDTVARVQARWLASISADTDVVTPKVVRLGGKIFQTVLVPGEDASRQAAMFTWVEGRRAKGAAGFVQPQRLQAVGRAVAKLHQNASRYRGDTSACRRMDVEHFVGAHSCLGRNVRDRLRDGDREFLQRVGKRIRTAVTELGEQRARFGLIHGDLEPPNWVFHHGEARPIDFDMIGVGHYLFDLAQVLWTHSQWPKYELYRRTLLTEYERIRPLAEVERRHLRTFEAIPLFEWFGRKMNDPSPAARADLKRWSAGSIKRIAELLEL